MWFSLVMIVVVSFFSITLLKGDSEGTQRLFGFKGLAEVLNGLPCLKCATGLFKVDYKKTTVDLSQWT